MAPPGPAAVVTTLAFGSKPTARMRSSCDQPNRENNMLNSATSDLDDGRPNSVNSLTASPGPDTAGDAGAATDPGAGPFPSGEGGTTGESGVSLPPFPGGEDGRASGDLATATSRYDIKRTGKSWRYLCDNGIGGGVGMGRDESTPNIRRTTTATRMRATIATAVASTLLAR